MKKFIVLLTVVSLFLTGYACAEGLGSLFGGLTSLFSLEDETAYSVGDTADLESASVKLLDVYESKGKGENSPADGNVYLICEFEFKNNTSEALTVSTMLCFRAFCDGTSCMLSLESLATAMMSGKFQADTVIEPGKKQTGVVGYEVPADWEELRITYKPDLLSSDSATFSVMH